MDPANVSLPDSPVEEAVPTAIVAGHTISASNIFPAQGPHRGFFTGCRRVATAAFDFFMPAPVRQSWMILFADIHEMFVAYPAPHRYGVLALIISIVVAEWQLPGCCFPSPQHVTNAIIGFSCAVLFVCSLFAISDFLETHKWPWQEDGWVWPWQAWLWEGTAYDLGASTNTLASQNRSPIAVTTPSTIFLARPGSSNTLTTTPAINTSTGAGNRTPLNNTSGSNFSMPPPTAFERPIIIPPTPQLPGGLRLTLLPQPTSAQIHRSGILGESPMPLKFKHFNGEGFEKQKADLQAIGEWHRSSGKPLHLTKHDVVPEQRGGGGVEGESLAKKPRALLGGAHGNSSQFLPRPDEAFASGDDSSRQHGEENM